jgi:hypothetical protein
VGQAEKEERGSEPTCAKLIGDGADKAVDLFEAKNVVLTGEMAIIIACSRVLKLKCDAWCVNGTNFNLAEFPSMDWTVPTQLTTQPVFIVSWPTVTSFSQLSTPSLSNASDKPWIYQRCPLHQLLLLMFYGAT